MSLLMLVDGNSLAYRAFFALPTDLATASGQVTNAVFGFTSMLVNLLKDHQPDHLAVAFDRPEPTFRHEMAADYKAGRAETPDILRQQLGLVRQVVDALNIPVVETVGFEADDVIATLATQAAQAGDDVIIVTGDRDTYQLVADPHVKVLYNRRGVSDYVLYDEAGIEQRTGVIPALYSQYAALRGDPSDNLAGVPGVGEKTAAKLINTYGGIDGIYAHLEELSPKLRTNLGEFEETVRRNAHMALLVRSVPVELDESAAEVGGWDLEEVRRLFEFLEMRTVWERFLLLPYQHPSAELGGGSGAGSVSGLRPLEVVLNVLDEPEAKELLQTVQLAGASVSLSGSWEGREGSSPLSGLAMCVLPLPDEDQPTDVFWLSTKVLREKEVCSVLEKIMSGSGGCCFNAHASKALMRSLAEMGIDARSLRLDTAIAAYLVDPAGDQYLLEDIAARYANTELVSAGTTPSGQLDLSSEAEPESMIAAKRAACVARLVEPLSDALASRGMSKLYDDIERPLVRVLARMELLGVRVDVAELKRLADELTEEVRAAEAEIYDLAGEKFLVSSVPQLRGILYDKLGLTPSKRTKTGFSTDNQSLEKLRDQHPIVVAVLRYREAEKLRSTYGEALLNEVAPDGRIHATFNQTVARTGRLSSDAPNLHNIPIRSDQGRLIRRAFVPAEGCRLLVADYDQIELRVIAHLSQDPGLIEAFANGDDIHRATAARIFGVEPSEVTIAMRSRAKMVSYGLAYGMEAFGLSRRLGIEVDEAAKILKAYFAGFPKVRSYMDRVVAEARDRGYTETLFGRRRVIPELMSPQYNLRAAGERQAMNAGIQGLAADIFKVALVRLDEMLDKSGLASRLVLQVHDEVLVEVPPSEQAQAAAITTDAMCGAAQLDVPLLISLSWGENWAEAKS